jgi:hypothetical protein
MAKTSEKRFDGHHKITTSGTDSNVTITTHTLTVSGNLVTTGNTTSVETTNSTISDNVIVLNQGETGAGITATTSGIEIDRGSATNVSIVYDDNEDEFRFLEGTSLTAVSGASPTESTHLATKDYVDSQLSGGGVVTDKIQEGDSKLEVFDAGSDLYFEARLNNTPVMLIEAGPRVTIGNIEYTTNAIENISTNTNLSLNTQGTGEIVSNAVLRLQQQGSDPSATASTSKIYAKTVGGGGTGVFVQTPSGTPDEMVSKSKAIVFGLIF